MVTRHPEPYLPPDARSLVSTTNFTVTRSGLEGAYHGFKITPNSQSLALAYKVGIMVKNCTNSASHKIPHEPHSHLLWPIRWVS
jgi:hypothetical protein